jgi:hypothetical protein
MTSRTGPGVRLNTTAPAGTFQLAATLPQTLSARARLENASAKASAATSPPLRIQQFIYSPI